MNQTPFIGNWRVTEYAYTPAGEFVGRIRQERALWPTQDSLRIRQICAPVEEASGLSAEGRQVCAALNRRQGSYVFDIQTDGPARRYLGPAVLGSGRLWREGVLTARGLWPDLGYTFTSYSFMVHTQRQITGGRFGLAGRDWCTLVGVAAPGDQPYAELTDPAPVTAPGQLVTLHADGTPMHETTLTYTALTAELAEWTSVSARYGNLTVTTAVNAHGQTLTGLEVAEGACRVGWRQFTLAEQTAQIQVYAFLP